MNFVPKIPEMFTMNEIFQDQKKSWILLQLFYSGVVSCHAQEVSLAELFEVLLSPSWSSQFSLISRSDFLFPIVFYDKKVNKNNTLAKRNLAGLLTPLLCDTHLAVCTCLLIWI